jgi:hypothetical protein
MGPFVILKPLRFTLTLQTKEPMHPAMALFLTQLYETALHH